MIMLSLDTAPAAIVNKNIIVVRANQPAGVEGDDVIRSEGVGTHCILRQTQKGVQVVTETLHNYTSLNTAMLLTQIRRWIGKSTYTNISNLLLCILSETI